MTWHGWLWDTRRQRWERVCSVEGLGACSRRLGEIARLRNVKDRYTTMTAGAMPTFRPAGRKAAGSHQPAQDATDDSEAAGASA